MQELIKELYKKLVGKKTIELLEEKTTVRDDWDKRLVEVRAIGYHNGYYQAIAECITLAEQLDEPKECFYEIVTKNKKCVECSNCGDKKHIETIRLNKFNFCPNCGAKIKREVT